MRGDSDSAISSPILLLADAAASSQKRFENSGITLPYERQMWYNKPSTLKENHVRAKGADQWYYGGEDEHKIETDRS